MVLFTLEGKIKNKKLVEQYIIALLEELNLNKLKRELFIEFVNSVEGENIWGYCWGDKECVFIQILRKENEKKFTFLELMQTLTHEMVHAKQYFRGELSLSKDDQRMWKDSCGEQYDYESAPWEIEARNLEKELFLKVFPFDKPFKN